MNEETPGRSAVGRGKLKLAAVLGAALLAIPGGAMIGNAFAADGADGTSTTTQQQQQPGGSGFAPVQAQEGQQQAPDGRDCPEGAGGAYGGGSSQGQGESGSTATSL